MDITKIIARQRAFSERTFGPGNQSLRVIDHLKKELGEVEDNPFDVQEWVDVILIALDGAWRHGYSPEIIAQELCRKQMVNESRTWPDWRTADNDKAIEHVR